MERQTASTNRQRRLPRLLRAHDRIAWNDAKILFGECGTDDDTAAPANRLRFLLIIECPGVAREQVTHLIDRHAPGNIVWAHIEGTATGVRYEILLSTGTLFDDPDECYDPHIRRKRAGLLNRTLLEWNNLRYRLLEVLRPCFDEPPEEQDVVCLDDYRLKRLQ